MSGWGNVVHRESLARALVDTVFSGSYNWVHAQLAALDMQMGRRALTSYLTLPDDLGPRRPALCQRRVTAEVMLELCQQGELTEAVEALGVLVQTDFRISSSLFYSVIKGAKKDLVLGRRVHALTVKQGHESDTFLCNHILRMYASHAMLQEAMDVFTMVAKPDAFMWSSIISVHVKHGQAKQAIQLYHRMRGSSVKPDGRVFVAALQACSRAADLKTGQQVHADVLASGVEPDLFVSCCLVDMYARSGDLEGARRVFDGLPQKDVVTWNAMISGYSQKGLGQEALHLHRGMVEEGIAAPDGVTFACLLQACASVGTAAMEKGRQLHKQVEDKGLELNAVIGCSLVNMYAKCGSLQDAQSVFDRLPQKTVVTWTAMIIGYSQNGMSEEALHLHTAMEREGRSLPDALTFLCLLQACATVGNRALEKGKQLHAQIKAQGLQTSLFVANALINMYGKCGSLEDAQTLFDGLSQKDVTTWTTLISGYAQHDMGQEALHVYSAMQEEGTTVPSPMTFVWLLQACACVGTLALEKGKQLHSQIKEQGLQADMLVVNNLLNMYAKCGSLEDALSIFDGIAQKDVVTWTTMIACYTRQGRGQEALDLYSSMQQENIAPPDSLTFVCLLQACASVGKPALEQGRQLHAQLQGVKVERVVGCSLVHMYAKCGSLEDAQSVFDGLSQKDVVTWTALIAGYSQQDMGQEALQVYMAMQKEDCAAPDSVTFVCLLQACASVGALALETGKQLHVQISEHGFLADMFVANSLVNMYAKCGSLHDAQNVFEGLVAKDVVTWNAMIGGYSEQGMAQDAFCLYSAMQRESKVRPNSVTFVCLLQACAVVGALHAGRQLHSQIKAQGLQDDSTVSKSLINMYAKAGSMVDAQQVFDTLLERDIIAWNALIAGYTRQGDSDLVFDLIHRMGEDGIQPDGVTFLSAMAVCSHAGLVDKGQEYFEDMSRQYGITPTPKHYSCMVDLLGRAGQLDKALAMARTMPVQPHDAVWHALLGACQKWTNVDVGRQAFHEAVKLDEKDPAAYVLMANIYTSAQMWEEAEEMHLRRNGIGAWKQPGQSWWTDMEGLVHGFAVGDIKHPETEGIYARLKQLVPKIMKEGYAPHLSWDIHHEVLL